MQRGLGEIRRRDGYLSNGHLDPARASGSLGFDPRLAVPNQDQQTPLGPGILHRDSQRASRSALGRTISLEIACDAFTTVSTSNCPTGGLNRGSKGREFVPRAGAGTVRRVALPFRGRPNGRSSYAHSGDRRRRMSRSRAPRKTAQRPHGRAPHCGQSRSRGPNGWPVRKGALASSARPSMRAISAPTSAARSSKFSGQCSAHIWSRL